MLFKSPHNRIFIALGSSIGDAEELFRSTQSFLEQRGVIILKKSENHMFPPYGGVAQNDFTNAVWEVKLASNHFAKRPYKRALQLLSILQSCEKHHGRTRDVRWGDRTLDLDLLIFEDLHVNSLRLTLPHPEMGERDFVMVPLLELL